MPGRRPVTSAEVSGTYSRSAQVPLSEPNKLKVSLPYYAVKNTRFFFGGGGAVCLGKLEHISIFAPPPPLRKSKWIKGKLLENTKKIRATAIITYWTNNVSPRILKSWGVIQRCAQENSFFFSRQWRHYMKFENLDCSTLHKSSKGLFFLIFIVSKLKFVF